MRNFIRTMAAMAVLAVASGNAGAGDADMITGVPPPEDAPDFIVTLPTDKGEFWPLSHTLGYQLGARLRGDVPDLDVEAFMAAMREAISGRPPQLSMPQMQKAMNDYNVRMQARAEEERAMIASTNLAKAEAFLAETGKRKGVKKTPSGLLYEVLQKGKGDSPTKQDVVRAHYHGTLPDGTVFDSTRDGEPAEFPLASVISGWIEGVQMMNRGAKYRFYIPPALAYGERGAGERIAPNQALVFEIELIEFHPNEGNDLDSTH